MPGLSVYSEQNVLNYQTGQKAAPSLPAVWIGLFTTQPTTGDGSGTEVSGNAYARVQVAGTAVTNAVTTANNTLHFASTPAWVLNGMTAYDVTSATALGTVSSVTGTTVVLSGSVTVGSGDTISFSSFPNATSGAGTAPSTTVNGSIITFPTPTGSWGTVVGFGLFDAVTSGNLLFSDYLGNFQWLPCTVSAASPGVITAHAHGYANGDSFVFTNEFGGTAPTFSAGNYTGVLTVAGVTTDTFNVTGVNTSATGNGNVRKVASQSIPTSVVASFAASSLTLALA